MLFTSLEKTFHVNEINKKNEKNQIKKVGFYAQSISLLI